MDEACSNFILVLFTLFMGLFFVVADKAIDLVDEACSNLQVQLESKPENIDILERRLIRLQVGV